MGKTFSYKVRSRKKLSLFSPQVESGESSSNHIYRSPLYRKITINKIFRLLKKDNTISSKKGFGSEENCITEVNGKKKSRRKQIFSLARGTVVFGARYTLLFLPSSKIITVVAKIIVYSDNFYITYDLSKRVFKKFSSDHDNDNKHESWGNKKKYYLIVGALILANSLSKPAYAINLEDPQTTLIKKQILERNRAQRIQRLINRGYSPWFAQLETHPVMMATLITSTALLTTYLPPEIRDGIANSTVNSIMRIPGGILRLTLFSLKCSMAPKPCFHHVRYETEKKLFQGYMAFENMFVEIAERMTADGHGVPRFIYEEKFNLQLLQYISEYLASSQ